MASSRLVPVRAVTWVDRLAEFEGVGVYYAATQAEAQACGIGPVAVVGGGNSAGQAALFLSRSCAAVHVIIRRGALDASMSRYLVTGSSAPLASSSGRPPKSRP